MKDRFKIVTQLPEGEEGKIYLATKQHVYVLEEDVIGAHQGVGANAMRIDWMARSELSQAIPPAYTEFIGKQLMEHLK